MSAFDTWFERQHGPRARLACSDSELKSQVEIGERAAQELAARELWDARHESALYGWSVRDADKPKYGYDHADRPGPC